MTITRLMTVACVFVLGVLCFACTAMGQTETAAISGLITDDTGAVVPGAEVKLQSVERGTVTNARTNNAGIYVFASVQPGQYQLTVHKPGFKQVDFLGLIVNIQDHIEQNFRLQVGSVTESVTVEARALVVNTQDGTVSTVVDRQFAENLPLNGRSFQTLIQLTPGVVTVGTNGFDNGQFSVNGQRASSNYWMVDGVSANIGIGVGGEPSVGGSLGSFSVLGGTNSLVSVDALQEFRIQTSTYAPEFGRTPGGQISIVTRSGTNQVHGTAFDYLRNDIFDANDWFADSAGLRKPRERQNDFGGTFSGPIIRDRTFFFFSYEGLRLRLPAVGLTSVPDASFTPGGTTNSRQSAIPALQPFLNAYPLPNPNSPEILDSSGNPTGTARFNASFSNPATLNAYSLRIDHRLNNKLTLFGRYNYSPSEIGLRGAAGALSSLSSSRITAQTATIGATLVLSPTVTNDLRFNYSRVEGDSDRSLDNFGGAVPVPAPAFPSPFTSRNGEFDFLVNSLRGKGLALGRLSKNLQRQFNIIDNLSLQRGSHSLKFGIDYRRLSPLHDPHLYDQQVTFSNVPSAENGNANRVQIISQNGSHFLFQNLGLFVQDTWRIVPRLTLTYGLRWDVDFAPSSTPSIPAVTGYNLNDLSKLAPAPVGTPPFRTPYGNIAPRLGLAYQLSQHQNWGTVLRGGFGVFYDLADGEVSSFLSFTTSYPYGAAKACSSSVQLPGCPKNLTFPLDPVTAAPPPITPGSGTLTAFDPNLRLPYTLEWNVAFEQALGKQQTLSASYIGATGRRLIQSGFVFSPNPNLGSAYLVGNIGMSDYNALQIQFQRRLSGGLQALASYTWAHSIDTASAGSLFGNVSNGFVPGLNVNMNRGPSDFDVRNSLSAAVTYDIPSPKINSFAKAILGGWSLQNIIQVRSAPPVDVFNSNFSTVLNGFANVRPDVVPGIPLYLFGSQFPGGKAFNNTVATGACPDGSDRIGPFCSPPTDANGNPVRQGNLGRNALRGFGATQWDFAVHRNFPIHESLKLQFRAEMFNVLNHPNFGSVDGDLSDSPGTFGQATKMLGQSLVFRGLGSGGFDPLYQIGGPRSIQLALKLIF